MPRAVVGCCCSSAQVMARFQSLLRLRELLIGQPLPTSAHHEERYGNAEALAILSSDALSSVAYAT
ncbi:MAG: hypothetical protein ACKOYH_03610, partial [Cyanobium sp.]